MKFILTLTIMLSQSNTVTTVTTESLEDCHIQGKAWLAEQLIKVDSLDFAVTYTCLEDK